MPFDVIVETIKWAVAALFLLAGSSVLCMIWCEFGPTRNKQKFAKWEIPIFYIAIPAGLVWAIVQKQPSA